MGGTVPERMDKQAKKAAFLNISQAIVSQLVSQQRFIMTAINQMI